MYGAQRGSERLSARLVATCADLSDANRRGRHRPVGTSRSSIVELGAEAQPKTYSNTRYSTPTAKELYSSLTSLPPNKASYTTGSLSRGIKTESRNRVATLLRCTTRYTLSLFHPHLSLYLSLSFSLSLFFKFLSTSTYISVQSPVERSVTLFLSKREKEREESGFTINYPPPTNHFSKRQPTVTTTTTTTVAIFTTEQRYKHGYGYESRWTPRVAA